METFTPEELKEILVKHAFYLKGDTTGIRADLYGANLRDANLYGANLSGAKVDPSCIERARLCPTGAFEAYKKTECGSILRLLIPADALRVGGFLGRKCRASKAQVLGGVGENLSTIFQSRHNPKFTYVVGETVEVADFCENPLIECAPGIHFFITELEAREY